MAFLNLGEKLQNKFKQHLPGEKLQDVLQWNIYLEATPVNKDVVSYTESMSFGAIEPNPHGRSQLHLGYEILQNSFLHPDQAKLLGLRALTERKPAQFTQLTDRKPVQFAQETIETLTLEEVGCFHSGTKFVYSIEPDERAAANVIVGINNASLVRDNRRYVLDYHKFTLEAGKIIKVLSNPDAVLEILVECWKRSSSFE